MRALHYLSLASIIALAACAHDGVQPDKVTIQTVNVAVPVACAADAGAKPALTDPKAFAEAVASASGIFGAAQVYAAAHMQDVDYIARLEAANAACRQPSK